MTFVADLEQSTMALEGPDVRAIGWLSSQYPFECGPVPSEFKAKLRRICNNARTCTDEFDLAAFCGFHECEMCDDYHGFLNIGVPQGRLLYVAPEMVAHYVEEHGYKPPNDFIQAVLACPLPGTPEFKQLAEQFNKNQGETVEREWAGHLRPFLEYGFASGLAFGILISLGYGLPLGLVAGVVGGILGGGIMSLIGGVLHNRSVKSMSSEKSE